MNIRSILNQATAKLEQAGSSSARLDAEILLSTLLTVDRLELYRAPERSLEEEEIESFTTWIERRAAGEPVAYIVGKKEFWSLLFSVNEAVLIPRAETEILVEEALKAGASLGREDLHILEIGVGSGAVSVALGREFPQSRLVATDIAPGALAVAQQNASAHGIADRIDFRLGSLFDPVTETFDIIVANPPYISAADFAGLPHGVRGYEPRQALLAGPEGTECHRALAAGAHHHLKDGGCLLMEMGEGQRRTVEQLLTDTEVYDSIETRRDYGGMERVIKARKRAFHG